MKKNLHFNPILIKMVLLISCFMLAMLFNQSRAAALAVSFSTGKRATINVANNRGRDQLTIQVRSRTATPMQLFIFSTDGILIKEVSVTCHQSTNTRSLKKGHYLFECFDKYERIQSGRITIK